MKQRLEKGIYCRDRCGNFLPARRFLEKRCGAQMHLAGGSSTLRIRIWRIGTHLNIQSKTVNPYNNSFELLVKDLERYKKNGYQVILLSGSRTRAKRLAE